MKKVSIVVTTYSITTMPYLQLCIESIRRLNYPKEKLDVILVCHRQQFHSYKNDYFKDIRVIAPPLDSYGNSEGLNFGIKHAAEDSEYYFILNDDVILTADCLTNLVNKASDQSIMMPISPCDNYRNYSLCMGFEYYSKDPLVAGPQFKILEKQFYRLPELKDFTNEMMAAKSIYPAGLLVMPMLCMFATLIPKAVWQTLGPLDENFKTGPDDIDYSIRASQAGIKLLVALDSLIWHFGGVTADDSISVERRKKNLIYFKEKWGYFPPGMPENILETLDDSYKYMEKK